MERECRPDGRVRPPSACRRYLRSDRCHLETRGKLLMLSTPQFRLFNPDGIPVTLGYSNVAEITRGKIIYISGQVARDELGELVGEENFRAQVEQVFHNIDTAVRAAGGTFDNVVKLNYYCVDSVEQCHLPVVKEIR